MAGLTYLPCTLEHLALIKPREGEALDKAYFMQPGFHHMVTDNFSLSAWDGLVCVAAAGIVGIYGHRFVAWALIGELAAPHMLQLTRKVRSVIHSHPARRIEMLVDHKFQAGHKWAKMLGFEVEAPLMRSSGFYGNDETLYARINPCPSVP